MFESYLKAESLKTALGINHFGRAANAVIVGQADVRHGLGSFEMLLPETIHWSPTLFDIYGRAYSDQRLGFEALLLPLFPEDALKVGVLLRNAILDRRGFHAVVRLTRNMYEVRLSEIYADAITEAGKLVGIAGTVEDLTDTVQVRAKVQDRLAFITAAAGTTAFLDSELCLLACSDAFLRCFGLETRSKCVGKSLSILTAKTSVNWAADHQRAMQGNIIRSSRDLFDAITGRKVTCPVSFVPWHNQEGAVAGVVLSIGSVGNTVAVKPRRSFSVA